MGGAMLPGFGISFGAALAASASVGTNWAGNVKF
jgi:hypothetical protein